jgi:hypothetical protein
MIQFNLKDVYGVGTPRNTENDTMTMNVNVVVGVVGIPDEDKYSQFKAEFTLEYVWEKSLSTADAEAGMITFAQNWLATNYPEIQ